MELVDVLDSKSSAARRAGSSPATGTTSPRTTDRSRRLFLKVTSHAFCRGFAPYCGKYLSRFATTQMYCEVKRVGQFSNSFHAPDDQQNHPLSKQGCRSGGTGDSREGLHIFRICDCCGSCGPGGFKSAGCLAHCSCIHLRRLCAMYHLSSRYRIHIIRTRSPLWGGRVRIFCVFGGNKKCAHLQTADGRIEHEHCGRFACGGHSFKRG